VGIIPGLAELRVAHVVAGPDEGVAPAEAVSAVHLHVDVSQGY